LKLANFGFKKVIPEEDKSCLFWKDQVFSLDWAAPEVHQNGIPTFFMDVFALGLTFGFTLIGRHLFGDTRREQIDRIKNRLFMTEKAELLLFRAGTEATDLVKSMINGVATERPKAKRVLKHRYFRIQIKESG
jgi:serine/threonine protein kinase